MLTYEIIDSTDVLNDGLARYVFNILDESGIIVFFHVSVKCIPSESEEVIQNAVNIREGWLNQ